MTMTTLPIGIYGVSTQSGGAFLADFLSKGLTVYGYARDTLHGRNAVSDMQDAQGIYLERPPNTIGELSRLIPFGASEVGHSIDKLVARARLIVVAHPAQHLEETATLLKAAGILERRIPLILSPPRTIAAPYIWEILGDDYPLVCFSTSPYSSKSIAGGVYIKRRKRTWMSSLEGNITDEQAAAVSQIFPQALFNRIAATTSLGNIGAIFHPTTYLLNYNAIQTREAQGLPYSFYMEGIADQPEVGAQIEAIDQIRLRIAHRLGLPVFGLREEPREDDWARIMGRLRNAEARLDEADIGPLRQLRHDCLSEIHNAVVSAQHWLDYSYGVQRISGESLSNTIGRTVPYQHRSVPQQRYLDEDIPTGLVPLEALAKRLELDHSPITRILDIYETTFHRDPRETGRNLRTFSTEKLLLYLKGHTHFNNNGIGKQPCNEGHNYGRTR